MRGIWWMLKLMAGLVLIGCLCAFALAVLFPELTRRAAAWAAVLLGSAALYWFANNRLGDTPRGPAVSHWRGEQFTLAAPLVRQAGLCLVLAGVGVLMPLVLLQNAEITGGARVGVLLGGLFGAWMTRAGVLGFLNMMRAGFALKLDAAGIHYPGQPLLHWTQVQGLALEPPRPDSEYSQSLVLQMRSLPEQPARMRALWRAALPGASIRRHTISLPLPTLSPSSPLLDAAQVLWRRHGQRAP